MKKTLVTGSSGLIGSEVCRYFDAMGWWVHGVDNNQRAVFFGAQGDTRWNQQQLQYNTTGSVNNNYYYGWPADANVARAAHTSAQQQPASASPVDCTRATTSTGAPSRPVCTQEDSRRPG